MNFAFYISNHGFGHAARNIPLIEKILGDNKDNRVFVKTDSLRIEMIKRNLVHCDERITYCEDYRECGVIFKDGCLEVDKEALYCEVIKEIKTWDTLIQRETEILKRDEIDVVISDITPWVLKSCRLLSIPSILISNFTWPDNYELYLPEELCIPYRECYKLADQVILYEFYIEKMLQYCNPVEKVSLVARRGNPLFTDWIRKQYEEPIVFISIGKSVSITDEINVENLPYTFVVTQGINLKGSNVSYLSDTVVNTMDYISASNYVISKCGWSTVAEILLNNKKCALLSYSGTLEEKAILDKVTQCNNGISISYSDFKYHLEDVLRRLDQLEGPTAVYSDDRERIVDIIYSVVGQKSEYR